ncbi:hypothetical protein PIB30_048054 [Stylosanthes scabra]|uniref:F-box domain-containing protein n=1 Tax=Stylosanthes scabra TaxID=79078 RepID=A0ABU6SI35_9FABA|nr:hypothetical protein [Stylosanthes scabra]
MAVATSGIDRTSALPDAILLHILSFLHSKTVVATSILSRRWRKLWHSAPAVDLDDSLFHGKRELFVRFAYAVILRGGLTHPILKFRLKSQKYSYAQCDLNLWVNAAVQRKVETFDLSPCINSGLKLPIEILTCETLIVLKLANITVDRIVTVQLPALKTLYMYGVGFAKPEYLDNILSGCPNIHHLQIYSLSLCLRSYNVVRTFCNLIYMNLSLYDFKWRLILALLNSCPMLQNLVIRKENSGTRELDLQHRLFPVPGCLSSHLRYCTLQNFYGSEVDIQFAIYIMQNASVLKRMTICCPGASSDADKLRLLKRICKIPRTSKTCELLFE